MYDGDRNDVIGGCVRASIWRKEDSICLFFCTVNTFASDSNIYTECLNSTNYPYGSRLRGP